MKRFDHKTSKHGRNQLIALALFLVIFCAFSFGINRISHITDHNQMETLELAISRSITHCYATEGHYPESLDYLIENYGITYDADQYFVDYQILGKNLYPDVTIIEK